MTPLCAIYVKWDSRWKLVGERFITLGTLESMLPQTGSWAIWTTQVKTGKKHIQNTKKCVKNAACSTHSLHCCLVQISQHRWCCRAAVLVLGPLQQRAFLKSTWKRSSPWASVETRQPKHFEPRWDSKGPVTAAVRLDQDSLSQEKIRLLSTLAEKKSKTEAIPQSTKSLHVNVWLNLCVCQSNVLQRAVDWIFSHMDDLECMDISEGGRSAADSESARESVQGPHVRDGPGSKSSSDGWEISFLRSLGN